MRTLTRRTIQAHAAEPGTSTRAPRASFRREKRVTEGWSDRASWQADGNESDRLHNLGSSQNYNINVDHGQSSQYLDTLFTGDLLGKKSDIADGSLRYDEFRKYNNIQGEYYIAPRFLWRVAMFMAKNYLAHRMPGVNIPLIMGIWGPKGTGKTFQTELSFKKMGVEPIIMSAGELESEVAGNPGRLIRQRYRRAAEVSKVNGRMSCLMINDIDAGLGRFEGVQCTVNNQIVVSTLMNICDDPTRVSIGGAWRASDVIRRIPIIVTGNDFSTMFAPLIRDGRMDKFYWDPAFDEKVQMVYQMYKDDAVSLRDVATLIERFRYQSLDFFGALRASTYDKQILRWVREDVVGRDNFSDAESMAALGPRLLKGQDLPEFEPVDLTLDMLVAEGERLEYEQQMVKQTRLSDVYLKKQYGKGGSMIGFGG